MLQLDDVFEIQKNRIICILPCQITIDEADYDERSFIEQTNKFSLPGILDFYVPSRDETVQFVVTFLVNLNKTTNTEKNRKITTINYVPGDVVIEKEYVDVKTDIGLLTRLLHGNIKYVSDPKTLINMIYDIIPSVDLVHIELIISNMFRRKNNLKERCRIKGNYNDAIIIGQKNQPFQDSWLSSLAFQYIDKAISRGLIQGKDAELNPIENIINENFKGL